MTLVLPSELPDYAKIVKVFGDLIKIVEGDDSIRFFPRVDAYVEFKGEKTYSHICQWICLVSGLRVYLTEKPPKGPKNTNKVCSKCNIKISDGYVRTDDNPHKYFHYDCYKL